VLYAPALLSFYKYWPEDVLVRPKLTANKWNNKIIKRYLVHILFHYNILLKHNWMFSTKTYKLHYILFSKGPNWWNSHSKACCECNCLTVKVVFVCVCVFGDCRFGCLGVCVSVCVCVCRCMCVCMCIFYINAY